MEEGQVTVDGVTRPLPKPFMVFATQNPIEYEGTFPLPEAQLDRFLLRLEIGYPDAATEGQIIRTQEFGHHPLETIEQVITASELLAAQEAAAQVKLEDNMVRYIIELCSRTRDISALYLGASPRGSLGLARAAKALAWLRGRQYVIPDDIKELAVPVLAHRVLLTPEDKLRGVSTQAIIAKLVNTVPAAYR